MEKENKKILKHYYEKLPKAVREVLTAKDLQMKVLNLVKKHNLRVDEGGAIEDEVALVLLGIEHPKDFMENLIENTSVNKGNAVPIARDINETIFAPIRTSLISLHEEDKKPTENTGNVANKQHDNTGHTIQKNIIKEKLEEAVHSPEEKKTIGNPREYEQDPYREPTK